MEKFRKNCYNLINLKNKGVFGVNKKIIFSFIFLLGVFSCTPLSKGLSMKSEVYNADNVEFYYDLTYKKDGETQYERQIWDQAYDILDKVLRRSCSRYQLQKNLLKKYWKKGKKIRMWKFI